MPKKWKGRKKAENLKNKHWIFIKIIKAQFYFDLLKIESKGTFSRTQIVQLLSKSENMAKKCTHFWPYFWPIKFSALYILFCLLKIRYYDFRPFVVRSKWYNIFKTLYMGFVRKAETYKAEVTKRQNYKAEK